MPLPPLPANNTDRVWLKYTSQGKEHEVVFRFPATTPQADQIAAAAAFANSIKGNILSTDAFTALRHQDYNSNLSFPLAWTSIAGTLSGTPDNDNKAKFESITGRSMGGRRCRITMFIANVGDTVGYRITAGHVLNTAVAAMPTQPVAIDGQPVIWNTYANIGYNAYWQRQFR